MTTPTQPAAETMNDVTTNYARMQCYECGQWSLWPLLSGCPLCAEARKRPSNPVPAADVATVEPRWIESWGVFEGDSLHSVNSERHEVEHTASFHEGRTIHRVWITRETPLASPAPSRDSGLREALVRLRRVEEPSNGMPIDTAPRDRVILLWSNNGWRIGEWDKRRKFWIDNHFLGIEPTGWHPLPNDM